MLVYELAEEKKTHVHCTTVSCLIIIYYCKVNECEECMRMTKGMKYEL